MKASLFYFLCLQDVPACLQALDVLSAMEFTSELIQRHFDVVQTVRRVSGAMRGVHPVRLSHG